MAEERLALTPARHVRYTLTTPYRDGTTHVVVELVNFIARLAALVPPPRFTARRFHFHVVPVPLHDAAPRIADCGRRWTETQLPVEYSMNTRTMTGCALAAATALAAVAPAASRAETPDEWQFDATVYVWVPDINMDLSFPTGGGSDAEITASDILDALDFAFMGALGAQKGKWGLRTDVIYLDLGSSTRKTEHITIGGQELPGATGKAELTITGWLWTTVGTYRLVDHPTYHMDVLAGGRMLDMSTELEWRLTGDLGDPPLIDGSGKGKASGTKWDGIVGVRGRAEFGDDHRWFVPYHLDIGAGDSDFTWQAIAGVGYSFGWGDVLGVWRYLDYEMSSNDPIQNADLNGPAVGVTFHF